MQLYHPDSELPATRVLFDSAATAARLKPWMNLDDLKLEIVNIRYKPGTSCVVSYKIDSPDDPSYCHAKAFRKDEWAMRKEKLGRAGANVLIDDEFSFALLRFPFDQELAGIESIVSDPQTFISKGLFSRFKTEEFSSLQTLAYKPNRRWTARLAFQSGKSCVVKVHDASTFHRARKSAEILKRCTLEGLPKRAGRSNRCQSLAYDWIQGSQLDLACDQTDKLEQVFDYLDRLHQSVKSFKRTTVVQQSADGINAIANYLAHIYPPMHSLANRIGQNILAQMPTASRTALVHGDFHEQQVLVANGAVHACDFDSCCVGDPMSDFGNFVSHVRARAYANAVPIELANQVDDFAMRHIRDKHGSDALDRYHWHLTAALYRLATHSFRNGSEDWMQQTERLLKDVANRLDVDRDTGSTRSVQAEDTRTTSLAERKPRAAKSDSILSLASVAVKNDPKLEFLAEALDAESAEHVFLQSVPEIEAQFGAYTVRDVVVRRHKQGRRCLIEYKLATDTGEHSILGKVSAKRLDIKSFDAQTALHEQHGFGYDSNDQICVPQTIGDYKPWKMWFQRKEAADLGIQPLKEKTLGRVTGNIADTLVKLHKSGYEPARSHLLSNELKILENRLSQVEAEFPLESERIAGIMSHCAAIADTIDENRLVTIHRDFYHDQIMFSDKRTVLVDLDLLALGHPAIDVGNFLAHLSEYGIRYFDNPDYWHEEEDAIVDRYLSAMPSVSRTEIEIFKVISLARHIHTSWTRKERRRITSKVIAETTKLINGLLPVSST